MENLMNNITELFTAVQGPFAPLANYKQFIVYKLVPSKTRPGKMDKFPINHLTLNVENAHNPEIWTDINTAIHAAKLYGEGYGVGFVFTVNDPFYFVDIDDCLEADNKTWSPVAMSLMTMLPGAAVEVSQSGRGLHIIGSGTCPDHGCKNVPLGLELYTEGRFAALTGTNAIGNAGVDSSAMLPNVVNQFYPSKGVIKGQEWTSEPVPEYNGTSDDNELLEKMLGSGSGATVFGARATFADLWTRNVPKLAEAYTPDASDVAGEYDESSADAALAQHLAFWTGKNCERMYLLMWRSALVRDKWTSNKNYLATTIKNACAMQTDVYTGGSTEPVEDLIGDQHGAPKLKGTDGQKTWGANIRAQKLIECNGNEDLILKLCSARGPTSTASFWIDNKDVTPEDIVKALTPIDEAGDPLGDLNGPLLLDGYQFLGVTQQVELFKGCVYIQNIHRVFTPDGSFLRADQFNATFGGYVFQLDADGTGKTTRKAWEAFTESQAIRYPKAQDTCFMPNLAPGELTKHEGRTLVNTYIPISTPRLTGDVTPFLTHIEKLLPDERDRNILISYMAACIQYKGVKFQWSPLIQGIEGNGKTLFTRCVEFAIGERYSHIPPADQISEKYNDWLFETLFIGVEDIYVPDHKREIIEILKPMITNARHAIRQMQVSQVMKTICCNFIFNSNYKDAVRKTRTDRRFCIFYTAQQAFSDIERDGMDGSYFPDLYAWLKGDGYAIVANYLETYAIPDELNPAGDCHRAPPTTSTDEVIEASLGVAEQLILEAVELNELGFRCNLISTKSARDLLRANGKILSPQKVADILINVDYCKHPALANSQGRLKVRGATVKIYVKKGSIESQIENTVQLRELWDRSQLFNFSDEQLTPGVNVVSPLRPST